MVMFTECFFYVRPLLSVTRGISCHRPTNSVRHVLLSPYSERGLGAEKFSDFRKATELPRGGGGVQT